MAINKIMLVEDDNNLRAIYSDRLTAEGYDVVSARDGEEALAMAVKEKPNLIISDVMMPKISGFDMLDILRTTPETKDVKVIMMTALSQAEDKARADKLGADKYLVKSQVTLEDVARVVHEVLGDQEVPGSVIPPQSELPSIPGTTAAVQPIDTAVPRSPVVAQVQSPIQPVIDTPLLVTPVPINPVAAAPVNPFTAQPIVVDTPAPVAGMPVAPLPQVQIAPEPVVQSPLPQASLVAPAPQFSTPPVQVVDTTAQTLEQGAKRVIQPINVIDPNAQPKIYELYEKEMAAQASTAQVTMPQAAPQVTPLQTVEAPTPVQTAPATPAASQQFDPNTVAL
jgi:CheY-like chemotaxis protein